MSKDELRLKVGTLMQLELLTAHQKIREPCKVIGYLVDESLILTMPRERGSLVSIRDNDQVAVRYMDGKNICGFKTAVIRSCREPYPYMHLFYPAAIERIKIRKAQRVATQTPVTVKRSDNEQVFEAVIMQDLSVSGAKLVSSEIFGHKGDRVLLETELEFAGIKEKLNFAFAIRSFMEAEDKDTDAKVYQYGVEFVDLSQKDILFIHGYIYECIVNGETS